MEKELWVLWCLFSVLVFSLLFESDDERRTMKGLQYTGKDSGVECIKKRGGRRTLP